MVYHRTCPACWTEFDAWISADQFFVECPNCHQNNIIRHKDPAPGCCPFCFEQWDEHSWNMTTGSLEYACRVTR